MIRAFWPSRIPDLWDLYREFHSWVSCLENARRWSQSCRFTGRCLTRLPELWELPRSITNNFSSLWKLMDSLRMDNSAILRCVQSMKHLTKLPPEPTGWEKLYSWLSRAVLMHPVIFLKHSNNITTLPYSQRKYFLRAVYDIQDICKYGNVWVTFLTHGKLGWGKQAAARQLPSETRDLCVSYLNIKTCLVSCLSDNKKISE